MKRSACRIAELQPAAFSSAIAQQQPIPPTLLQRIRQLLGLVQPVAAGGSRGNSKQLCLISPFVASQQEGAVTPTATPTIRVLQPLNEVRIEKMGSPCGRRWPPPAKRSS